MQLKFILSLTICRAIDILAMEMAVRMKSLSYKIEFLAAFRRGTLPEHQWMNVPEVFLYTYAGQTVIHKL